MLLRFFARDLRPLVRPAISLAAAGFAGLGFLQIRPAGIDLGLAVGGVFFLACGASACNQAQEKDRDALMRRTENRPLPAGRLRSGAALGIALFCIAAGCILLYAVAACRRRLPGLFLLCCTTGCIPRSNTEAP
jgi:protoheme IX farnesyltransferase